MLNIFNIATPVASQEEVIEESSSSNTNISNTEPETSETIVRHRHCEARTFIFDILAAQSI